MAKLTVVRSTSRAGRRTLERLDARGEGVLDPKVLRIAAGIVQRVRVRGDRGLLGAVRKFEGLRESSVAALRRTPQRIDRRSLPAGFEHALERSIAAVERYHQGQRHGGFRLDESGVMLEERRQALGRVGVYVPGGRATYPSSVVMSVVPARLAGVREIVVATPAAAWERSPALRHALHRLGVEEVWTFGGAHAVAAMAFGTQTLERVDKIVGPGNAFVTAAKHLVSSRCAIDGLAGPSEVLIVASAGASPELVARDLLAQAEHDPLASVVLVTDDAALARSAAAHAARLVKTLPTAKVASVALGRGAAILVADMEEALVLAERYAPEHLQLVGDAAEALVDRIRSAGAIFVGESTPVVFGDYIAGPSHVLPTGGSARYASALGVEDFVKRSHVIRFDSAAASRYAAATANLADVEGLPAHAASARARGAEERRES